ncbi:hypothetical protein E2C01_072689 [Portunus trituberculatus]|uniref:Uncharacterized protein n=1 Tax=Portunus trituberculatus TaxID=210409 RepID=A0A5B7I9L6_PORTR|nr:hypothetical protein [Portunus trituberculatus]
MLHSHRAAGGRVAQSPSILRQRAEGAASDTNTQNH